MRTSIVCLIAVLMLARSAFADDAEEAVFSGPQVGEKLTSFKARGVLADLAGKEFDLVAQADGKPITIVFFHSLTRPSAALTRAVGTYAAQQSEKGMVCGVVFLSDDPTETQAMIKRAARALPKVPIGISVDGAEGPGAYGLNRKVTLTVLVAKDNKVTANFALVQPSVQADAPKIGHQIALAVGKDETPTLKQMGVVGRYAGQPEPNRPPAPQRDPKLDPLLRAVIQKTATKKKVDQAASEVEAYCKNNPAARGQVGDICRRVVNSEKFLDYGTEPAREYLKKWAAEFKAPARRQPPPKRENEDDRPPTRTQPKGDR